MGVIKSIEAPLVLGQFRAIDVEQEARQILAEARQQAQQLLSTAREEVEAARSQAAQQGKEEGLEQGRQEALVEHRAKFEQAIAALSEAAEGIQLARGELESAGVRQAVELALAIARRVTKRQGCIDPQVLCANLEEALKRVVSFRELRIAINPAQRQTFEAALPQLQHQWPSESRVSVIEDPAISRGGCRLFTEQGSIDADLDEQLDRIAAELLPSGVENKS